MTQSNKTTLVIVIAVLAAIVGLVVLSKKSESEPGQYDKLAQCLTDKGVKFYGASWCPHCAEQKRMFGSSMKKVTYVECAVPGDNRSQTVACQDAKIESYPTWVFPDGTRQTGVVRMSDLASKSGCELQ
jgi:glutaredoxin